MAQSDGRRHDGLDPARAWTAHEDVIDRSELLAPEGVSPGRYLVRVGLYRLSDGRRLPLDETGNRGVLSLDHVEVGH
jgi:hypothetical protein